MVGRGLQRVYARPGSWVITFLVSILTLTVMLLLPNYSVLLSVLLSPVVSLISKLAFFTSLYGSLATNFTFISSISVVLISLLFGINAALLVYYIRRARGAGVRTMAGSTTLGGVAASLFGIGCAACGSAIVGIVLQLVGIGFVTSLLPFHGAEFGLIGVALLLLTTYSLLRKINDPLVCLA